MTEKPSDIVSEEEIIRVHANANFGLMSAREVVGETVLKFAVGYGTGHTAECIVIEHGLASRPRGRFDTPRLTKKGLRYARAVIGSRFNEITAMARPIKEPSTDG